MLTRKMRTFNMTMYQRIIDANLTTAWDVVNLLPMVFDFIQIDDMEIELSSVNDNVMIEFNIHSTRKFNAKDRATITHYVEEQLKLQQLHTFADVMLTVAIHIRHGDYKRAIYVCYDI